MSQNRSLNHTYLIPVFIFLALIFDGIVMNLFAEHFISPSYILTPRLLLFVLVVFTIFFPKQPLFLYALLFGIIYDSYYAGILGLYTAGLATVIYLIKRLQTYLNPTVLVSLILFIFADAYLETFIFAMYRLLGYTGMSFQVFLSTRLGPTLLLNIVFFIVCYYPFYRLSQWMYEQ